MIADAKHEVIRNIRQNSIDLIEGEFEKYGGFDDWYSMLSDFRAKIKRKYIRNGSPYHTYRSIKGINSRGEWIDHHVISYLAPMDIKRIGWGG